MNWEDMNKKDPYEMATREKVLERPDLYSAVVVSSKGEVGFTGGIFLRKGTGKVSVKMSVVNPFPNEPARFARLGEFRDKPPIGPKYTGPIDDEMMANIMMYGG